MLWYQLQPEEQELHSEPPKEMQHWRIAAVPVCPIFVSLRVHILSHRCAACLGQLKSWKLLQKHKERCPKKSPLSNPNKDNGVGREDTLSEIMGALNRQGAVLEEQGAALKTLYTMMRPGQNSHRSCPPETPPPRSFPGQFTTPSPQADSFPFDGAFWTPILIPRMSRRSPTSSLVDFGA